MVSLRLFKLHVCESFGLARPLVSDQSHFFNLQSLRCELLSDRRLNTFGGDTSYEHCPLLNLGWWFSRWFRYKNLHRQTPQFVITELESILSDLMAIHVHKSDSFMFTIVVSRTSNLLNTFDILKKLCYLLICDVHVQWLQEESRLGFSLFGSSHCFLLCLHYVRYFPHECFFTLLERAWITKQLLPFMPIPAYPLLVLAIPKGLDEDFPDLGILSKTFNFINELRPFTICIPWQSAKMGHQLGETLTVLQLKAQDLSVWLHKPFLLLRLRQLHQQLLVHTFDILIAPKPCCDFIGHLLDAKLIICLLQSLV